MMSSVSLLSLVLLVSSAISGYASSRQQSLQLIFECSMFFFFFSLLLFHKGLADCDIKSENRSIFLWSIQNEETGSQGYLFGTIHVPYNEVWDQVSDRVREAFGQSDTVLLEVDLNNEETLRKLVRCKKLPRRQTALSYLPPELFAKIKTFMSKFRHQLLHSSELHPILAEGGVEHVQQIFDNLAGNWHRKRPEWLLFTLYQLCENLLTRSNAPMLDVYLATQALEKEKRLEAIESAEEQCNPVSDIPLDDIVFAIGYTIQILEKMYFGNGSVKKEQSLSQLISSYRCGTLQTQLLESSDYDRRIPGISLRDKQRAIHIDSMLKEDIITKRNLRMAKRIDQIVKETPKSIVFTAIGTGHFLGQLSILRHLTELGYSVKSIQENEQIKPSFLSQERKVKSLWTREFIPPPPLVVIEIVNSSSNYGLIQYLTCIVVLRFVL